MGTRSRFLIAAAALACMHAHAAGPASAWRDGRFSVDTAGVVSRSDIVLERPNLQPEDAMPLGNGRLGVALWAADGMTVQLNRADTMPERLSPGQVVIPALQALVSASDFRGRLDLHDGEFVESGGGMTARAWIEPDQDLLVVDVSGADPSRRQSVTLKLWQPRTPQQWAQGSTGLLWQAWKDDRRTGAKDPPPGLSHRDFGALAGITVQARDVSARRDGSLAVAVDFIPRADGSFRVLVVAPHYAGGDPQVAARMLATNIDRQAHRAAWHTFWKHTGPMKLESADGVASYMENLRAINLYAAAAEIGESWPGSQAGVGDLFSSRQDHHYWDPAAFWHWNLRAQIAANLGAGLAHHNLPYFALYRDNLAAIARWTRGHMDRPGICVPETMRFNGQGHEYENWGTPPQMALNCDARSLPYYNARTLSTGAEVAQWIWRQYRITADRKFLADNYPLMAEAARFLLAYARPGDDGRLHTQPSNAHETQWDVKDPTTDLAAMQVLFATTAKAARLLGRDDALVARLRAALGRIPPFPRTDAATRKRLLASADDVAQQDVIAPSHAPASEDANIENIGLEPVWPYQTIDSASPLFELARRTYANRPYKTAIDWSFDPIHAALLNQPAEVAATLVALTDKFQVFPNGFASLWGAKKRDEFYVEQGAVVSTALQLALARQGDDGIIEFAPAWPRDWDADGSVYIDGNSRLHVQVRAGELVTAAIDAGTSGTLVIRNPWPGQAIDVFAGAARRPRHIPASPATFRLHVRRDQGYLLQPTGQAPQRFEAVTGSAARNARKLGHARIGLPAASNGEPMLGATPQMGFNNWNSTHCRGEFNEVMIRGIADRFVDLGLKDAGYRYINIDDCWASWQRDAQGKLQPNPERFPGGIKALADYIQAKGLKFGIYTSAGSWTCEPKEKNHGFPGGLGHEKEDAAQFAAWGVDYLKYDNCNNEDKPAQPRYLAMADALRATGRPIFFSVCEWGENKPWLWAGKVPVGANSWRTTYDIRDTYASMLQIFRQNVVLDRYAGPGHWNDPDMLEVGNGGMSSDEYRSHFSLWSIMAAPLLIGTDLRKVTPAALEILLNKDVIAVDQDPLGIQGRQLRDSDGVHVIVKPLADGSRAVVLFNETAAERTAATNAAELGFTGAARYAVRDLWRHDESEGDGTIRVKLAPHATAMYRIRPL